MITSRAWITAATGDVAHKVINLLRHAPKDDIVVMLMCMSLTVLFDMVIAIPQHQHIVWHFDVDRRQMRHARDTAHKQQRSQHDPSRA
jgi:hypothetical protein